MSRLTRRAPALVALLLGAAAGNSANAQPVTERPPLRAEADTNDWYAYFVEGAKQLRRSPEKAIAYFRWAGRIDPSQAEPLVGEWAARWRQEPALLEQYLAGAEFVVRSGEGQRIDSLLFRALAKNPMANQQVAFWVYQGLPGEWGGDHATQGFLAYSRGKFADAAKEFAKALARQRAHPSLHYQRALALASLQQYDSAAAELQRLIDRMTQLDRKRLVSMYESKAMYEYARGRVLLAAGRRDEARDAFGRALVEDLSLASAHAGMALLATLAKDHAAAAQEYDLAVQLEPSDPWLRFGHGTALMSVGQLDEAATQLRKAIELEPYYAAPYYNLSAVLEAQGKAAEAAMALEGFVARASAKYYAAQLAAAPVRLAKLRGIAGR